MSMRNYAASLQLLGAAHEIIMGSARTYQQPEPCEHGVSMVEATKLDTDENSDGVHLRILGR